MNKKLGTSIMAAAFTAAAAVAILESDLISDGWWRPANEVSLPDVINDESANDFITQFNKAVEHVQRSHKHSSVLVTINSRGGFISPGTRIMHAIEDAVEETNVHVTLRCEDIAASMAAEILIATKNVQRDASAECEIFLHRPRLHIEDDNGELEVFTLDRLNIQRSIIYSMMDDEEKPMGEATQWAYDRLLARNQIRIDVINDESNRLANTLAEATRLEPEDFHRFFDDGDRYIFSFYAGVFGFIDTIEGEPVPESYTRLGPEIICVSDPEYSFCDNLSQNESAPILVPEF